MEHIRRILFSFSTARSHGVTSDCDVLGLLSAGSIFRECIRDQPHPNSFECVKWEKKIDWKRNLILIATPGFVNNPGLMILIIGCGLVCIERESQLTPSLFSAWWFTLRGSALWLPLPRSIEISSNLFKISSKSHLIQSTVNELIWDTFDGHSCGQRTMKQIWREFF